ncbi:hypothetical protein ACHAXT_005514 [Thalassiosira profunda]
MVLESSDLQHRRRPAKSGRSKRRSTAGRASTTTRKRRRRRSGQNRSAMAAMFLCATVLVSLALLANRRRPKAEAGRPGGGERLMQKFMKKQRAKKAAKWTSPHGAAERRLESDEVAEEKARRREGRYNSLYKPKFDASALGYDIYNCPSTPPEDYPKAWTTTEVLGNWNPNEVTTLPPAHRDVYQGLCVFDYQTQYATALSYRNAEVPFIIRNDPKVTSVVQRWEDDPEYLHRVLGDVEEFRTERSPNSQFMWYRLRGKRRPPEDYQKPPNDETEMTFGEWLEHALEKDGQALGDNELIARAAALRERRLGLLPRVEAHEDDPLGNDGNILDEDSEEAKREKYYYFRINADLKSAREASPSQFIYDELTFLDPRKRRDSEMYIVDPKQERGINCRFGMRGVTAVNHFDMSRNVIALFGGERRYVLASPSQCSKMALHPPGHPSLRHSSVDWTNPADWENHPEFKEALVNEVVLHAGDVLYLPTNWFHFIVNLSVNYQCNARSGTTHETAHFIEQCGFAQH